MKFTVAKEVVEQIVKDAFRFYGFEENRLLLPADAAKVKEYITEKLRSMRQAALDARKLPRRME